MSVPAASSLRTPSTRPWPMVLVEAVTIALCCSVLAFWINGHQTISWADEGLLWYGSQRVLAGELPVRDFFSYDPGRYFWTAAFYRLAGDRSLHTTLLAASTFAFLALATTLATAARAGLGRGWQWLMALVLTVAFAYPRHKAFDQGLSLFLACAIVPVLNAPGAWSRWAVLGLLSGLAATFGRNHGVFFVAAALLTALFLWFTRRRDLPVPKAASAFAAGTVAGYLPVILLCVWHRDFLDAFLESVRTTGEWQLKLPIPFPWRISTEGLTAWRAAHVWLHSLLCLAIPASYAATLAWLLPQRDPMGRSPSATFMAALSLAGLPYLHQAFDRADFAHFVQGVLPAFALFTLVAALPLSRTGLAGMRRAGALAVLAMLGYLWAPYVPSLSMTLAERANPGATAQFEMDGSTYRIESYQARLLTELRSLAAACRLADREFLAAPHFPGLYAFLGVRAPIWENYYLHPRPEPVQEEHRRAMEGIRLAVIAPTATIDQLDELRFGNLYGSSLRHLDDNLVASAWPGFPYPLTIYTHPQTCPKPTFAH